MSITKHALWSELQPFFYAEADSASRSARPRLRIELKALPDSLRERALSLQMPCVACGCDIHPIRARVPSNRHRTGTCKLYYACTCPLDEDIGCSRGGKAREEYEHMRQVLRR